MIAKDFQEATANRIVDLFKEGHNRVLLADEVGLGKTIVARTVVAKTGDWRKEVCDEDYVVVYICSNAGIADQNCGKLGIPKENRVSISEGRLSMQHLVLAETKSKGNVRLIPMTPATSIQMRGGAGTAAERALAYIVLDKLGICAPYSRELSVLLRTYCIHSNQAWQDHISWQNKRIQALDDPDSYFEELSRLVRGSFSPDFISEIKSACRQIRANIDMVEETAILDCGDDNRDIIKWSKQRDLINKIRKNFAQISLGMLNPDLVIMDEFQKFKDLIEIDENDQSESAMLSQKFLRENTESCILLLSATPYKPFSSLSEFIDGEETHIQGFMRVMDFLIPSKDENARFHRVWDSYTEHLAEIHGHDFSVLIASKNEAEEELYNHVCRTERRETGIVNTDKAKPMPINILNPANIRAYIDLQKIMQALEIGNFPVDYVKSAPFLMSFMNYKVKDRIDAGLSGKKQQITSEERARLIQKISSAFLKRRHINGYRQLPNTNARLNSLFDEVFRPEKDRKSAPELLLWIPPSNRYYVCGGKNIFEQCEGYSKTLVFSSWEMVPRVIAALTSYEAERLVNNRIGNKGKDQHSYYAVQEIEEMESASSRRKRRGQTRFLMREQREIVAYPSIWLSGFYEWKKYYGCSVSIIRNAIKSEIQKKINAIASYSNLPVGRMGAKQLISLLDYMDDMITDHEPKILPDRLPADDDIDVLVNMAIGSPGVCLYRALSEISDCKIRKDIARDCCEKSIVSMFNRPESRSIMDAVFEGKNGSSDEYHYEQVFLYCVDGNFQAMLDEYKFALGVSGEDFVEAITNSFLQTSNLPYVSQEFYKASFTGRPQSMAPRLRVHFAAGYFDAKTSDKTVQRVNNVRNAFNSPFRPFVLATTSVGQEGLDFHLYSRKVVHWNLPSNPIDLEQREGRINRYMCHAIRQNIAANETPADWNDKFTETKEKYGADSSDMIPYWCLPDHYPFKYQIERIVPMYPFSQDKAKYDRLINILALYRLTLGQPRQEEMISILQREDLSKEQMEELFINLSPYSRNIKRP